MKKAIVAIAFFAAAAQVLASCPPYQPYRCVPTISGKQICGCGY